MQTLTPEQEAILKSKLQVGDSAFRGRIEVDVVGETLDLRASSISLDKSLNTAADQASVLLTNEGIPLGWATTSLIKTNQRIRIYQWYGDAANEILVFTGLIDRIHDSRNVIALELSCRDLMALLIDQTFSAIGPQGADEDGAVRTMANGVYLNMEISDIVDDILDRAGWPTADRDITPTSYVLDEFIIGDGESWAGALQGDVKLGGLVGYSAYADEFGVFHFGPTSISQNLTEPVEPVYTFRANQDITALDDDTDQYELRTRIKVRGPLTTTELLDTWRELWRTSKITKPVGIWYDPTDSANIRVISRATKRLYKLRQSDRVVLSSVYLGGDIAHPLGLSGDPASSLYYYVLNCPWIYTGSTSGNSIKKVRKSDNGITASYALPNGRWSALKVSSAFFWLTNLDTDRFYKRSRTDGSAIADYQHTYNAVVQANPSGVMVDGTTLFLFWSNGGTTARFLKCDESAPGTVTGVVKTAGTALHGGEMDTTTHVDCYGDSDSLNLTAKFTLLEAVDQTEEVFAEVVDTDLEDELGDFAQMEDREHDTHPGDADHPYEVRRMTMDLSVITNLAQATETAQRQLDLVSQRRRVLDAGIIGNPALQKIDPVAIIDSVTGLSDAFVIDTYRSSMTPQSYLGTLALRPIESISEIPDEDPDAEEIVFACPTSLAALDDTLFDSGTDATNATSPKTVAISGGDAPAVVVAGMIIRRDDDSIGNGITIGAPWTELGDYSPSGGGRHTNNVTAYIADETPPDLVVSWISNGGGNRTVAVRIATNATAPVQAAPVVLNANPVLGGAPTQGNLLLQFVFHEAGSNGSTPTGWTLVADVVLASPYAGRIKVFAKCAGAGESTTQEAGGGTVYWSHLSEWVIA